MWGGRFTSELNSDMQEFNSSLKFDRRMYKEDVVGSQVYAEALQEVGLITVDEKNQIVDGLNTILEEWNGSRFIIKNDEDIHTANERRLKELIGSEIGGKLHTGRSRNDQVATDMRLWLMNSIEQLNKILIDLIKSIVLRAETELDVLLPGYTHLQRAQPILWAHWLLSYAQYFKEDLDYLNFVLKKTKSACPLGSGALAGNPFKVDRELISKKLGFDKASANSMQSVSDRDFIVCFQQWASLCAIHCSRIAEDLIIYSTKEFNFVTISDAYSTGSSIMPQKKNADSLELIRGKSGRIMGTNIGFQIALKGLCSTYNKDLQNDKEGMFDTFDTISKLLIILTGTLSTLKLNKEKCLAALSSDMLSTDVAYYLVNKKNLPFRNAHELAGKYVIAAEKYDGDLSKVPFSLVKQISNLFDEDIKNVWNYQNSVNQYNAKGGTGLEAVKNQIADIKNDLKLF